MSRITILGAGAWGTAMALSLARRTDHQLTLWSHSAQEAETIATAGENTLFLPGFKLPPALTVTAEPDAVSNAEILVSVIPSEFLRGTIARLAPHIRPGQIVVSLTKGVEDKTGLRMTEVIAEALGPLASQVSIGAFSGPSFALEVAQGQPTAVTVAFADESIAAQVQQAFGCESLRLYTTTDVIGVELGGALKNVIAIAAGVASGMRTAITGSPPTSSCQ